MLPARSPLQGFGGQVGAALDIRERMLAELGALIVGSDIDEGRRTRAMELLESRNDARWFCLYEPLHGWDLLDHVAPLPPRRLPPLAYEEMP